MSFEEVATEAGRLATFNGEQQLAKRRPSASKKKTPSAVSWPHESPSPEALAHAGFYYRPTAVSVDSVTCFLCEKSLDGWEAQDDPIREHLAHVPDCGWAVNVSIGQRIKSQDQPQENPMKAELLEARLATYKGSWPHDGKRGWKCTSKKLANAGWCYNPIPEADDCVICFYCNCSLDGWEPKDDPWEEHHRRAPECPFFELMEQAKLSKPSKAKRSTASRTSRQSTVSNSTMPDDSEMQHNSMLMSADEGESIATVTSTIGKTRKKPGPKKGKTTRKTKRSTSASVNDSVLADSVLADSVLADSMLVDSQMQDVQMEDAQDDGQDEDVAPKTRAKRGTRTKKQVSIDELPAADAKVKDEVKVKAKPGRKPRAKKASSATVESAATDEAPAEAKDAQLAEPDEPIQPARAAAGKKRTSDGLEKAASTEEAPVPRVPAKSSKRATTKANKGSIQSTETLVEQEPVVDVAAVEAAAVEEADVGEAIIEEPAVQEAIVQEPAVQKPAVEEPLIEEPVVEERIVEKPVIEQPVVEEPAVEEQHDVVMGEAADAVPPPPPPPKRRGRPSKNKQAATASAQPKSNVAQTAGQQTQAKPADTLPSKVEIFEDSTQSRRRSPSTERMRQPSPQPSPQSSDAENHPPSSRPSIRTPPAAAQETTKRVPLAPAATPSLSPSKRNIAGGLISDFAWEAIDIDAMIARSPALKALGRENVRLEDVLSILSSPEKKMTVEEWMLHNARQSEEQLRAECERVISIFESEGNRALRCLEGVHTA